MQRRHIFAHRMPTLDQVPMFTDEEFQEHLINAASVMMKHLPKTSLPFKASTITVSVVAKNPELHPVIDAELIRQARANGEDVKIKEMLLVHNLKETYPDVRKGANSLVHLMMLAGKQSVIRLVRPSAIFICGAYPILEINVDRDLFKAIPKIRNLPQPRNLPSAIVTTGITMDGRVQSTSHPILKHSPTPQLGTPIVNPPLSEEEADYFVQRVLDKFMVAHLQTVKQMAGIP